jgi:hypothetical protein
MMYALIALLAVGLIAVLVYLRHVNRRQVASLFRSKVRELQAGGMDTEQAFRQAIGRFIRRPPFNLLQTDELTLFVHVLQDLGSPVDVGAEILQQCENKQSILEIKEAKKLIRLLHTTDMKLSLQQLIQNAKLLHGKDTGRYPNIAIALLASLSAREGWTFVEEHDDDLIFDYRQERVRIPKQASGKDAARRILFEELARRPMPPRPETDKTRKSARQELTGSFDALFDETFLDLGKIK